MAVIEQHHRAFKIKLIIGEAHDAVRRRIYWRADRGSKINAVMGLFGLPVQDTLRAKISGLDEFVFDGQLEPINKAKYL